MASNETGPGNPFWSPVTPASASPTAQEEPSAKAPTSPAPSWPATPPADENPFAAESVPSKNAFAASDPIASSFGGKIAGGFDSPLTESKPDNAFGPAASTGFSGFESAPTTGFFDLGEKAPVKNEGGEPEARFQSNPFESDQAFATLFSKQSEADASIPFPGPSAFAPRESETKEPEGIWGAMFSGNAFGDEDEEAAPDTGFSGAPFESIGNLLKQASKTDAPVAKAPPLEEPASVFEGFGSPAPAIASPGASAFAAPDPSSAFATGFAAFAPPAPTAPREAPALEKAPEIEWSFDPIPVTATPAPALATEETMNPVSTAFEAPSTFAPPPAEPGFTLPQGFGAPFGDIAPAVEPVRKPEPAPVEEAIADEIESEAAPALFVPAPTPANVNTAQTDTDDDLRDLELRAIFSTSESFTLSLVARKVVGLPGINSCSLSTPGKLVQASRREENRLGNEAREMVATLRSLAKLTGLPEAKTFTLQTDRGIVSLFLEGDCCVTVHHDSGTFQPGVREKLILVARSLVKLRE